MQQQRCDGNSDGIFENNVFVSPVMVGLTFEYVSPFLAPWVVVWNFKVSGLAIAGPTTQFTRGSWPSETCSWDPR